MTYSIVARDKDSGAFGAATATGGPAVGALVPHARAGLGALATQGYTNPYYAFDGLEALHDPDAEAQAIVDELTAADAGRAQRQLIIVDRHGRSGGWCGEGLTPFASMILEDDVAVAGNLLANARVVPALLAGYRAAAYAPFEDRLLAALVAAEAEDGDSRGTKSAALKTVTDQSYAAIDVRVDLSDSPIADLARVLESVKTSDYAAFFATLPRRTS